MTLATLGPPATVNQYYMTHRSGQQLKQQNDRHQALKYPLEFSGSHPFATLFTQFFQVFEPLAMLLLMSPFARSVS